MTDVESQLMPSLWCKRMDPSIVVDEHVRITTEESNRVAETIPSEMQITYKEGSPSATLDIFGTDLPNESPIFVYISGGYWQELSGDISAYPVMPLYQNGIVSVIPNYGRAPKATMTEIVEEIISLGLWLVQFAKKRKSRSIVLSGHSAGGHLCATLVSSPWFDSLTQEEQSLFKGMYLLGACLDLTDIPKTSINDPLGLTEDEVSNFSPLHGLNLKRARKNSAKMKTFLIYGQNDAPGLIDQGRRYAEAIKELSPQWMEIPERDHFNLVEHLADPDYVVTKSILTILKDSSDAKPGA